MTRWVLKQLLMYTKIVVEKSLQKDAERVVERRGRKERVMARTNPRNWKIPYHLSLVLTLTKRLKKRHRRN